MELLCGGGRSPPRVFLFGLFKVFSSKSKLMWDLLALAIPCPVAKTEDVIWDKFIIVLHFPEINLNFVFLIVNVSICICKRICSWEHMHATCPQARLSGWNPIIYYWMLCTVLAFQGPKANLGVKSMAPDEKHLHEMHCPAIIVPVRSQCWKHQSVFRSHMDKLGVGLSTKSVHYMAIHYWMLSLWRPKQI